MIKKMTMLILVVFLLLSVTSCEPGSGVQISTPIPEPQSEKTAGQIDVPGFKIQLNAPGVNPLINSADAHGRVAGLLTGIWHGIISPGTLVVSFLNSNVQMYEVHNDGSQYNFGFLIGIAILSLILGVLFGRRRRRPIV